MPSFRIKLSVCIFAASSVLAQSAAMPTPIAFDVASVRPSKPGSPQHSNVPLDSGFVYGSINPDDARSAAGGHLIVTHQPLWRYIAFAYKLSGTQELSLRFSMFSGVPKSGAPSGSRAPSMLRLSSLTYRRALRGILPSTRCAS